jgi:hypothetical protein
MESEEAWRGATAAATRGSRRPAYRALSGEVNEDGPPPRPRRGGAIVMAGLPARVRRLPRVRADDDATGASDTVN